MDKHDDDCFLSGGDDGRFPCICGPKPAPDADLVEVCRKLPLHGDAGCDKLTDDEWQVVIAAVLAALDLPAREMAVAEKWHNWPAVKPDPGTKIVIVCNDGASSSLALMNDECPLEGECGEPLSDRFMHGAIWTALPDDYPLGFMEATDADWY